MRIDNVHDVLYSNLEKIGSTRWKREYEGLSNKNKKIIQNNVSNPYEFAAKSDDRLKRIAKNTGTRVYDNVDEFLGGDGSRKSLSNKFLSYGGVNYQTNLDEDGNKIIVADKHMPIPTTILMGKKQKDRVRGAYGVHEGFESVSINERGATANNFKDFPEYGTHMGPEVIHRESAYAARMPEKDRKKMIKMRKKQPSGDYSKVSEALRNFEHDASLKNYANFFKEYRKWKHTPSQYDDLLAHGVKYGESPVVDKEKLKQHKQDFANGVIKKAPKQSGKIVQGVKDHPYATALAATGVAAATTGGIMLYKKYKKKKQDNAKNSKEEVSSNKVASEVLDEMYKEANLSQAQKVKLLEGMIGAGAGSLVGASTGAIRARHISKKKGETKEEAKRRMRNNVLGGALVGAGAGATTSTLVNKTARINAKKTVPFYNDADLNKHREDFLNKYRENREKNYAMVNGDAYFGKGESAIRKAEINMLMNSSFKEPNEAKAGAIRSTISNMEKVKGRLENESMADFMSRLRDKKSYIPGMPIVEGVTHKNGKPIVGGHFDNDDFVNFVQKSGKKGEFKANQDLINNRLFGGFRSRDTDKAKAYIAEAIKGARADAKKDILADVAAVKAQTRAQYQKDKAKNAKKAERMIYHYSNLADKLEGRR